MDSCHQGETMTAPDFPRITLENLRRTLLVFDSLTDPELRLIAANQLVLDAETFAAKVGYWADALRQDETNMTNKETK